RAANSARQAQIDRHRPIGILFRQRSVLARFFLRHRLLPQFRRGRGFLSPAGAEASIFTQHDLPPPFASSNAPRQIPAANQPPRRPRTSRSGTCPFPTPPTPPPPPPPPHPPPT